MKDSINIIKPSKEFIGIKFPFKVWNLNLMVIKVMSSLFAELASKTFVVTLQLFFLILQLFISWGHCFKVIHESFEPLFKSHTTYVEG